MNNQRRKQIQRAIELITEAQEIIDCAKDEEEEYRDNMPENMQSSERYEQAENAANELSEAADSLDSVISNLESASE